MYSFLLLLLCNFLFGSNFAIFDDPDAEIRYRLACPSDWYLDALFLDQVQFQYVLADISFDTDDEKVIIEITPWDAVASTTMTPDWISIAFIELDTTLGQSQIFDDGLAIPASVLHSTFHTNYVIVAQYNAASSSYDVTEAIMGSSAGNVVFTPISTEVTSSYNNGILTIERPYVRTAGDGFQFDKDDKIIDYACAAGDFNTDSGDYPLEDHGDGGSQGIIAGQVNSRRKGQLSVAKIRNVNDGGHSIGTAAPWAFVIDASPSMAYEIETLLEELTTLVSTVNLDQPLFYSLTTFQNNDVNEPLAIYEADTKIFASQLAFLEELGHNIDLQVGTVCEEASLTAILDALTEMSAHNGDVFFPDTDIFVFTDAEAQTVNLGANADKTADQIIGDIESQLSTDTFKDSRINFILTGNCNGDDNIDTYYSDLATRTGGLLIATDDANVESAIVLLEKFLVDDDVSIVFKQQVEGTETDVKFEDAAGEPDEIIIAITGGFGTTWTIEIEDDDGNDVDVATFGTAITYTSTAGAGFASMVIDTTVVTLVDIITLDSGTTPAEAPIPWQITVTKTGGRRRGRNMLQSSSGGTLTIYTGNSTISVDFEVTNVENNDISEIADTGNGLIYYEDGGSFAVIVTPSNDETVASVGSFDFIEIESFDGTAIITKSAISLNNGDGSYYALFTFDEIDEQGLYNFRVKTIGTDINGLTFTRQLSTTYTVSDINIDLVCSEQESNGYRFFTDATAYCDIFIQRRDSSTAETFDITALVDNGLSAAVELTLSNETVQFNIGELNKQLQLSVDILSEGVNGELFSIIVRAVSQSDTSNNNLDSDGQYVIREDTCPVLCNNSPCSANEISNCNIYHENTGCSLCQSGYFKKNFNYNCENCQHYFGDGCKFCQDFHGCGQCKNGYVRTFDSGCDLYICTPNNN